MYIVHNYYIYMVAQLVECLPSMQNVMGLNPT